MKQWIVTYAKGLKSQVKVEAEDEAAARIAGLAEYRRTYGGSEIISVAPISKVVESVEEA